MARVEDYLIRVSPRIKERGGLVVVFQTIASRAGGVCGEKRLAPAVQLVFSHTESTRIMESLSSVTTSVSLPPVCATGRRLYSVW